MILSNIFGFKKPEATDNATVANDISVNAAKSEAVSKNGIALQTNTSTTAYISDFPLADYVNGHSFVFIPLYSCTGPATINFNSLGIKKLFQENGTTQISSGAYFEKAIQYLLIYDSAIDSGIGAFKTLRLSPELPAGTVAHFAGNAAPLGWLERNGAAVSRTTYARLFAAIGTTFGSGDGSTTFNLPDSRGEFDRGWDNGRGIDAGRTLGSYQAGTRITAGSDFVKYVDGGDPSTNVTTQSAGSFTTGSLTTIMTRPRNQAFMAVIKY